MELKMIDGRPFIVQRQGKKEFTRPPGAVVEILNREITDGMTAIAEARDAASDVHLKLEAALLNGESTVTLRAQIAASAEVIDGFTDDVGQARDAIRQVWKLVDGYKADLIRKADADRLQSIANSYSDILMETV
jgi:hypothetical protein